jgi:hypothetical protein
MLRLLHFKKEERSSTFKISLGAVAVSICLPFAGKPSCRIQPARLSTVPFFWSVGGVAARAARFLMLFNLRPIRPQLQGHKLSPVTLLFDSLITKER